ncbi:MAG: hypothetical protein ACTHJW_20465 [Streptosporangiaceae bacterium]
MTESQETDTHSKAARQDAGERPAAKGKRPKRSRGRLRIGGILRTAVRTGRRHLWPILTVAMVVALVIAVAEVITDNFVDPRNNALSVGGTLSVEAISLFGTILLAGFLCKLVGQDKSGGPARHEGMATHDGTVTHDGDPATLVRVMRTLPWFSLIVADILFAVLAIAGLVLLVIPGLIVLTLFAVVGPAIEIEHRKPFSGLRRSADLVRHHFWTVALLAMLPQLGLAVAESLLPSPHGALHIVEVVVIRGIVLAPFEAAFGLILVALCYRLIDLEPRAATSG